MSAIRNLVLAPGSFVHGENKEAPKRLVLRGSKTWTSKAQPFCTHWLA